MSKNHKPKMKVLLVGKSGSGKNTVQDYLVNRYGIKPLMSYTTRSKRYPEEDTHIFITEQEYEEIKQKEKIIAYTFYNGNHYFATEEQFKESDIYIIDLDGLLYMRNQNIDMPFISIYIDIPSEIRAERMARRGDSPKKILERIDIDDIAFEWADRICDYTINNSDSEKTANSIARLVGIEEYEFDTEREIIDKLKQVQTLLQKISPDIDNAEILFSNCSDVPLNGNNRFLIHCLAKRNGKEQLTITTINRNNESWLIEEFLNQPSRLATEKYAIRID